MQRRFTRFAGIVLIMVATAAGIPASAATSWGFLFDMNNVTNDNQLFLHLAVGDAGFPRPVLEPILPRLPRIDSNLPVTLFLARHSGRPLDYIVSLRAQGVSWSLIFSRCGVPLEALYAGIDRDPGPPYGNAWGHWKKHGRITWLDDPDIEGLVQVQLGQRICGVPAYNLAYDRGRGMRVYTVVADTKGRPWKGGKPGKGHGKGNQGENENGGHGNSQGKGHGNGHGNGHD